MIAGSDRRGFLDGFSVVIEATDRGETASWPGQLARTRGLAIVPTRN